MDLEADAMACEEKKLEERLREVGSRLESPPSAVDELLAILDQTENLLSRVDQSPTQSMSNALRPSMRALVAKELLGHSDIDVKVAVASCFSEITRITAPETPYDDNLMKELFQMIVQAFENLDDVTSRSFPKRVAILETVAKVRSCVVMLDLECDALILEMFNHFLKTIRPNHSDKVFSSMEMIMTLVFEESEDISSELILCLLDSVKNDNNDVLPVVRKLGEKVLSNCAAKLKPYVLELSQSSRISLKEYDNVVASICQESSGGVEQQDMNASGEIMGSPKMEQPVGCPEEVPIVKSPRSMMSNGAVQMGSGESVVAPSSPEQKPECHPHGDQSKMAAAADRDVSDNVKPVAANHEGGSDHEAENTKDSETDKDSIPPKVEVPAGNRQKRGRPSSKQAATTQGHGDTAVNEQSASPSPKKKSQMGDRVLSPKDSALKESDDSENDKDSMLPKVEVPGGNQKKRGRPSSKLTATAQGHGDTAATEQSASPSPKKKSYIGDKVLSPKDSATKESDSLGDPGNIGKPEIVAKVSEEKSQRQTSKKGSRKSKNEDMSPKLQIPKIEHQDNVKVKKDSARESVLKEVLSSSKSSTKESKNQRNLEESATSKSGRKRLLRGHGSKEVSETPISNKELDDRLVGLKIRVWWPIDKKFYDGVVDSYDPVSMKHKVVYNDGDKEILLLKKERWEFISDDKKHDTKGAKDSSDHDASSEEPKLKRAKSSPSPISEESNKEAPPKRKGRPPKAAPSNIDDTPAGSSSKPKERATSKSKDENSKPATEHKKDDDIVADKSSAKTGSKSEDDAQKSKKSDDTPKSTGGRGRKDTLKNKSSEDSPRTGSKLRGTTTLKPSIEPKANAPSEKGKARARGSEASGKGHPKASPKAPESSASTGRKRKRKG